MAIRYAAILQEKEFSYVSESMALFSNKLQRRPWSWSCHGEGRGGEGSLAYPRANSCAPNPKRTPSAMTGTSVSDFQLVANTRAHVCCAGSPSPPLLDGMGHRRPKRQDSEPENELVSDHPIEAIDGQLGGTGTTRRWCPCLGQQVWN